MLSVTYTGRNSRLVVSCDWLVGNTCATCFRMGDALVGLTAVVVWAARDPWALINSTPYR